MGRFNPSDFWKPTKNGRFTAVQERECPKCYEIGEIIALTPYKNNLHVVRMCQNPECPNHGETWHTHEPWHSLTYRELKEYEKWVEHKSSMGRKYETAKEKINKVLQSKYPRKANKHG